MGAEKPLIRARSDFFAGEGELEAVIRTQPWDATPLGSWDEELPLFLERRSNPEESYHTSSCSSLADDAGVIAGVLCPVTKDTERVIAGWRFACLDALSSGLAPTGTRAEVLAAIESQLRANNKDLPFTLTYLFDDDGIATLACMTDVRPRGMPDGIGRGRRDPSRGRLQRDLHYGVQGAIDDVADSPRSCLGCAVQTGQRT